jgi:hypothetical protein
MQELVLLKCTSTYPASPENTNILQIPHLRQLFGCEVGLSTTPWASGTAVASVALGATVIEKALPPAPGDGGVDSASRWEPANGDARPGERYVPGRLSAPWALRPTAQEKPSLSFVFPLRDQGHAGQARFFTAEKLPRHPAPAGLAAEVLRATSRTTGRTRIRTRHAGEAGNCSDYATRLPGFDNRLRDLDGLVLSAWVARPPRRRGLAGAMYEAGVRRGAMQARPWC